MWLKLEHPNVLPLFGTIRDPNMHPYIPAMVSPWMENGALSSYLVKSEDLTLAKRLVLVGSYCTTVLIAAEYKISRLMTSLMAYSTVSSPPLPRHFPYGGCGR